MGAQGGSDGIVRHLGRLLKNDRGGAIIVAMDQGVGGVNPGFEDPVATVGRMIASEPEGLLLTPGLARRSSRLLAFREAPALVIAIDQGIHRDPDGTGPAVAHASGFSVEEAVRVGADAVKTLLIMGMESRAEQLQNMAYLAEVGEQCRRWELPLMIEPYLWGVGVPADPRGRAEVAADSARIGVELGADLLKVEYSGDPETFAQLVRWSPVPVLVLGGPKRATQREVVADVITALNSGAAGITIGRNIWQQPDPHRMVRALSVAIRTRDLEAAMSLLEPEPADTAG